MSQVLVRQQGRVEPQASWRQPPRQPEPTRSGVVDEPGDSGRLRIGLSPVVHQQYAELAG
jgi:hypothetical protein